MVAEMDRAKVIRICEELIKSFNPVTHSIDTHCFEHLGDVKSNDASTENVFIQQVVYGWYRERRIIECFIKNFYADNAARLLRTDMIFYSIFTYLALFRLDEMGFPTFKAFALTQDPTKIYNFASYLFNKENLWNCLRADWMKVSDLSFVEDELIASVEQFLPELNAFCAELEQKAVGMAAAKQAAEELKKSGAVGLAIVKRKDVTRPISPNLTRPKARPLPVPEKIDTTITANEIPSNLNKISLMEITRKRQEDLVVQREKTKSKYSDKLLFKLNQTKHVKPIEEIRKEVEEGRAKELAFDSSFFNPPPDYSKVPATIRVNAASILREDYLYRKQQEKDVLLLKAYEAELRDPSEYYAWQSEMKERDNLVKLEHVADRREQAKLSAEEAKAAVLKQRTDNKTVADILRTQADAILKQKTLEKEISVLRKQQVVQTLNNESEKKLKEARNKVIDEKVEQARLLRIDLEKYRLELEVRETQEEAIRADKIRRLQADNIQKKHVAVFDPTETAHVGVLDEMSYVEMKERLALERSRAEEEEERKRHEIIGSKQKKARELEERAASIMRARQAKADATAVVLEKKKEARIREQEAAERIRLQAAIKLDKELTEKREIKRSEVKKLAEEEAMTKRKQQYLSSAAHLVEENRVKEQLLAVERQTRVAQEKAKQAMIKVEESMKTVTVNRGVFRRAERVSKLTQEAQREEEVKGDKAASVATIKSTFVAKKIAVLDGQAQHNRTHNVIVQHNPYAVSLSAEIHADTLRRSQQRSSGVTFS